MTLSMLLELVAGLGLFLYGMELMGDGLSQLAGDKLRLFLDKITKNNFIGMVVGIVFTAIIQSSSATTVLVVSFVNAGLMTLEQTPGLILGANIGTTMTGQLIALNLSEIAPLFILAGVIMVSFMKDKTINKLGTILLGFGVLFFGMETMSGAMSGVKDSPQLINFISTLSNPFLAFLTGIVVTAVLQSSSATSGILILLATQGILDLHVTFYILLGVNIGTTVSALLASITGSKAAKRTACVHTLLNIFGSIIMFILMILFMDPIYNFITSISGSGHLTGAAQLTAYGRDVANANTIFKCFQVIIFFPFCGWLVKIATLIIPGSDETDEFEFEHIGNGLAATSSTTVLPLAIKEIRRMSDIAIKNVNYAVHAIIDGDHSHDEEIALNEKHINQLLDGIDDYLMKASELELPINDRRQIGALFNVVKDIERIGDHAARISKMSQRFVDKGFNIDDKSKNEMAELLTLVISQVEFSIDMFSYKSLDHLEDIVKLEDLIDSKEKDMEKRYLRHIQQMSVPPEESLIFTDCAAALERIADHGTNIAYAILNDDSEDVLKLMQDAKFNAEDYLI